MWFKLFHNKTVYQCICILTCLVAFLNHDVFTWSGDFVTPGRNIQLWRIHTWEFIPQKTDLESKHQDGYHLGDVKFFRGTVYMYVMHKYDSNDCLYLKF